MVLLIASNTVRGAENGFQERYFSDVQGETWALHIEPNRTFSSLVTIKLQMGNAQQRFILLGSIQGNRISGSYKPFLSAKLMADDKPFTLQRLSADKVNLRMEKLPDFPSEGIVFQADSDAVAVDSALIGLWSSEPKLGVNADNPYLGEQWIIHFRSDGTLCQTVVLTDKRQPGEVQDPCETHPAQRWKTQESKILLETAAGDWQHAFTYRLMGGRLVASYPDGKRLVANLNQ